MKGKIIAVGGAHVDIIGTPDRHLREGEKNYGRVRFLPGGVAFNIAANLSLLGMEVSLVSLFCSDDLSKIIKNGCDKYRIDVSGTLFMPDTPSPSFMAVTDRTGSIRAAISDTRLYEAITPDFLAKNIGFINGFDVCVLDANLSKNSLEYLLDSLTVPVFLDPVSLEHGAKLKGLLSGVHTLKANRNETEFLSGVDLKAGSDLKKAGDYFVDKGIKSVFFTLGEEGIYFSDGKTFGRVNPEPSQIINTNGAGDAAMAGLVYGFINDLPIAETAEIASAASSIALESGASVNPELCEELLILRAGSSSV